MAFQDSFEVDVFTIETYLDAKIKCRDLDTLALLAEISDKIRVQLYSSD